MSEDDGWDDAISASQVLLDLSVRARTHTCTIYPIPTHHFFFWRRRRFFSSSSHFLIQSVSVLKGDPLGSSGDCLHDCVGEGVLQLYANRASSFPPSVLMMYHPQRRELYRAYAPSPDEHMCTSTRVQLPFWRWRQSQLYHHVINFLQELLFCFVVVEPHERAHDA